MLVGLNYQARPMVDHAGKLMMDTARPDKPRYAKIIAFTDRDIADRFSASVIEAVDEYKEKEN
jgi:hypothetical protein